MTVNLCIRLLLEKTIYIFAHEMIQTGLNNNWWWLNE
jgi:hypothetical protein